MRQPLFTIYKTEDGNFQLVNDIDLRGQIELADLDHIQNLIRVWAGSVRNELSSGTNTVHGHQRAKGDAKSPEAGGG